MTHVEQNLRQTVDLAWSFARVARSFARDGMVAHDRRITEETIRRLCEQASVAKDPAERADWESLPTSDRAFASRADLEPSQRFAVLVEENARKEIP